MFKPKAQSWSTQGANHSTNDDSVLVNPEQGIYVICDGVSEGGEGKFASKLVAQTVHEKLGEAHQRMRTEGMQFIGAKRLQIMQEATLQAFSEAQTNLQKKSIQDPNYKLAATTCISVWLDGRFAILAHIGDSRAYLLRAGKLYQLTKDHSGLDELLSMGIPFDNAIKNPLARSLTRAFGNARYTHPDLLKIEFQANDILILCTDGLYTAYASANLQQFFQQATLGKDMKDWVAQAAHSSGDDASLILINFPDKNEKSLPIQASDRIKLMGQTPLCKYFDYVQKSHIAALSEVEHYKAGSIVLQEGTEGETMYIVAEGTLEVIVDNQHITYKKAGEFLGEIALIQQSKRTATLIAKEDTILLSLKRRDLNEAFKKDLLMERHFYKGMLELVLDRFVKQTYEIAKMKGV